MSEPPLHSVLGFLPFFGAPQAVGNSLFAASLVLTIMVVPIIAALTRDLFVTVPLELRDGAEALGATRLEMIRGVVLPMTSSGVIAACVLGFGRAIGEAIAVSQVIGDQPLDHLNLFLGGNSAASVIALQYTGSVSALHTSSLFYLATILLVFSLLVNFAARQIGGGRSCSADERDPRSPARADRQRQPPSPADRQPRVRGGDGTRRRGGRGRAADPRLLRRQAGRQRDQPVVLHERPAAVHAAPAAGSGRRSSARSRWS